MGVNPSSIALQPTAVATMDGFEIGPPLKSRGIALGEQTHEAKASNAVAVAERDDMREFVDQDGANAVTRCLLAEQGGVDLDEVSHPQGGEEARQAESRAKVIGLTVKRMHTKIDLS